MKILGLDTASHVNAVGVISDDRVLADFVWEAKDSSLEKIVLAIDFVLAGARLRLEDIEGLAVGIGPGSWTGVRIGLTVGKTLAYACGKPICGVTSLDMLAYYGRKAEGQVCPLVDAGRGMVYSAVYKAQGSNVARKGDYYAGNIDGLVQTIRKRTLFVGDAAHYHRDTLVAGLGPKAVFHSRAEDVPRGSIVALLAAHRLSQGESDDAFALTPLYLRESAAQALLDRKNKSG